VLTHRGSRSAARADADADADADARTQAVQCVALDLAASLLADAQPLADLLMGLGAVIAEAIATNDDLSLTFTVVTLSWVWTAAESSFTTDPRRHQSRVSLAPIFGLGVTTVASEPASRAVRALPALRRDELRRSDLARSWRPVPKL
jgi:hypothetical protein